MLPIKYLNLNSTTTTTSKMADILWKEAPPSGSFFLSILSHLYPILSYLSGAGVQKVRKQETQGRVWIQRKRQRHKYFNLGFRYESCKNDFVIA